VSKERGRTLSESLDLKKELEGKAVVVKAPGGETGKLYGAVTTRQIAHALKEQLKLEVDSKDITCRIP